MCPQRLQLRRAVPPLLRRHAAAPDAQGGTRRDETAIAQACAEAAGNVIRAGDRFSAAMPGSICYRSPSARASWYIGPMGIAHAWAYLPDLARAFVMMAERAARARTWHFAGR
jgi:hypothetical protein